MTGVSEEIVLQILIFGKACLVGICMTAMYDVIRIFRRILRHGIIWISIEDACYWLIFAVVEFVLLYQVNNGVPRLYIFSGTAIGAALYHFLLGRYLMKLVSIFIRKVKKRLKKAFKEVTMKLKNSRNRGTQ